MDTLTPLERSAVMARVRSKDAKPETALRKELWRRGLRYRKHCKNVFCKPDICFPSLKIAVFCDSEFWHGKYFLENKRIPKSNVEFWKAKFERNITRDKEVGEILAGEGWTVVRIWNEEIRNNLRSVVENIIETVETAKRRLCQP